MNKEPRYILNISSNLDIIGRRYLFNNYNNLGHNRAPLYYAQAVSGLIRSYLLNVNYIFFVIHFANRHFCVYTRIWCYIIYARGYIDQQISCTRVRNKKVKEYMIDMLPSPKHNTRVFC